MGSHGRNNACPCGSGLKYKRCCLNRDGGRFRTSGTKARRIPPALDRKISDIMRARSAQERQREKQQGLGHGIVSTPAFDGRVVAVGTRIFFSKKWQTFHDFLREYIVTALEPEWFAAEASKPEDERHPIALWADRSHADLLRLGEKVGSLYSGPMTGMQRAFLNLAYNLYLIEHHTPGDARRVLRTFSDRLKSARRDDFIGKLFETYAAAVFLKAGFKLAYEDESLGHVTHVEFVATYPKTGRQFSVEVKSRNRAALLDGPVDDVKRLRIHAKLASALKKRAEHTRVVFIEVNVPDILRSEQEALTGWPKSAFDQVRELEGQDFERDKTAYVFVTNHAFHNNLDALDAGTQMVATGFRIPFGPHIGFEHLAEYLEHRKQHEEMLALITSIGDHHEIPATFDGSISEFSFNPDLERGRLQFGRTYVVPTPDGREILGILREASVDALSKSAVCIYETEDGNIVGSVPLNDAELGAWRRHPDTFFGEVRQTTKHVNN